MEIENVCLGSLTFFLFAKLLTEGAYSKGEGLVASVACATEEFSESKILLLLCTHRPWIPRIPPLRVGSIHPHSACSEFGLLPMISKGELEAE